MRRITRVWQHLKARLCWLEIDALKAQRKHTAKVIIALEAQVAQERRHLAGIDEAIRLTGIDATKNAMRAQL